MVVVDDYEYLCEEEKRLRQDVERKKYWKKWGPYVAERQWATGEPSDCPVFEISPKLISALVREDYSYATQLLFPNFALLTDI